MCTSEPQHQLSSDQHKLNSNRFILLQVGACVCQSCWPLSDHVSLSQVKWKDGGSQDPVKAGQLLDASSIRKTKVSNFLVKQKERLQFNCIVSQKHIYRNGHFPPGISGPNAPGWVGRVTQNFICPSRTGPSRTYVIKTYETKCAWSTWENVTEWNIKFAQATLRMWDPHIWTVTWMCQRNTPGKQHEA